MNTSLRRSLKIKKFASFAWDMQIHTERALSRPDVVIKDHAKWCCKVIDVSVPSDRNTWTKWTKIIEKISKNEDFEIEIRKMWGLNRGLLYMSMRDSWTSDVHGFSPKGLPSSQCRVSKLSAILLLVGLGKCARDLTKCVVCKKL